MSGSPWIVKPEASILSPDCVTGKKALPAAIDTILYHGHCPDGFAAAFGAFKLLGDKATYTPLDHGPTLRAPDVTGKHVAILDFCFPSATIQEMKRTAASLIILDHHASAQKELMDLGEEYKVFDMGCSGATLSWLYFHAGKEVPLFLRYVEDKDIWRWAYKESEAFTAGYATVPQTFEALDALLARGEEGVEALIGSGRAILQYRNGVRDSHVARGVPARLVAAPQFQASVVNGTTLASEIGNAMCQVPGVQLGVIWFWCHKTKSFSVSLRSDSDAVDVSLIAKQYGGGGHRRAAGFSFKGPSIEDLFCKEEMGGEEEGGKKKSREEE